MSQAEKRLEAMRNNPLGDWTIADVEVVCRAFGIACHPPVRGSHYDLSHPSVPEILTLPFKRPIRPVYIRKLVAFGIVSGTRPMFVRDYYVRLDWLPASEGGGWHATVPDLPGCMSDGETVEQAMANVEDAIECWIAAARRLGRAVPAPAEVAARRA